MNLSRLLAALPAFACLALAGPAAADPLEWVSDARGNAWLGEVEGQDAPVCPARVLTFELQSAGTADVFDGEKLKDSKVVYQCVYAFEKADMQLWFQTYQPTSGLPKTASKLIDGPEGLFAGDGFEETHQEATNSCAQSIEVVTRPERYDASALENSDKIKPSSKVACLINLTYDKSEFVQITGQRDRGWATRIITNGDPKFIELATGVATLLYAVQKPQPDWIRELMRIDDVL